jgi:peptidoglycan/xylan/chitin deacetylase (PgdA/CDA1 family)
VVGLKDLSRIAAYHLRNASGAIRRRRDRRIAVGEGWASVIVFHRVTDDVREDGITIAPWRFRAVLQVLKNHYHVISASHLLERMRGGPALTGREVVITFDDGYLDNYEIAAPLLDEFNFPAVFFLTAGYIGGQKRFPWDEAKGIPGPLMSWEQAREMAASNFEIGCHTRTHPDLGKESIASARSELIDLRPFMEDKLGAPVRHFAYPFGGRGNITPEWIAAAKQAGFSSLFTGFGGLATAKDDMFWIPRLGASHQRSTTELRIDLDDAW